MFNPKKVIMLKNILNLGNVSLLSKDQQKNVNGGSSTNSCLQSCYADFADCRKLMHASFCYENFHMCRRHCVFHA